MRPLYVIENLIKDKTLTHRTEDALYVAENLYNERPSLPYRTESKLAPEWVCVDMGVVTEVTFVGIFNHNLTDTPTLLQLCGGNACGVCTETTDLTDPPAGCPGELCGSQPIANFKNTWAKVDTADYQYYTLQITDNPTETYLEIGEWVLGVWSQFSHTGDVVVRLSPGRDDGPEFFMGKDRTHWGQDWSTYYSEYDKLDLKFTVQNDPCIVDEMQTFLQDVQRVGGRFIIVPDDEKPFCYYVVVQNLRDFAGRKIYGRTGELREWRLRLKSLTEGARLL